MTHHVQAALKSRHRQVWLKGSVDAFHIDCVISLLLLLCSNASIENMGAIRILAKKEGCNIASHRQHFRDGAFFFFQFVKDVKENC